MTPITGNTYPVRQELKALGGRWNAERKAWMVPNERAEEARKLVSEAPAPAKPKTAFARRGYCADCGAPSRGYYRCYSCSLEYKEGGSRYKGGMSYFTKDGDFVLGDDD